jgi:integrase
MRPSELFRLQWKDVGFDANVIKLRKENTKTMQPRWIGVTERFKAELRKLWDSSLKKPDDLVFGIKDNVRTSWETLCDLAKIKNLQLRDFRNKTSTDYKLAGIPTELAMKGTGHTQYRTYEGYVKVDQEIARRLAQDLENFRRERQKKQVEKAKGE